MNRQTSLQKYIVTGIFSLLLTLVCFFLPIPAHAGAADGFQPFVDFLQQVEEFCPGQDLTNVGFPVNADELQNSLDLITCLADAGGPYDVAVCTQDHGDNLPDEIDMVVDCYILFMDGDYIGLAWTLGGDFACAVLKVALGGVPVCDLLQELAEVAEAVYDFGKAMLEFFGDAAAAVWDAAQAVGCALGIGGCDNSPSPPPYLYLFKMMHPYLQAGVDKREAIDGNAFVTYLAGLKEKILTAANKEIEDFNSNSSWLTLPSYTRNDIDTAAAKYVQMVDTAWSNDIAGTDGTVRHKRQLQADLYINHGRLPDMITSVLNAYRPGSNCLASCILIPQCEHTFSYDFAHRHIDRWKKMPLNDVPHITTLQQTVQTNLELCSTIINTHKNELVDEARKYLLERNCRESAGGLLCSDSESFSTCRRLMGAFEQEDKCSADTTRIAGEIRAKLMARFRKEGSRFYPLGKSLHLQDTTLKKSSPKTIVAKEKFPCYRPTHKYFLGKFYKEMFAGLPGEMIEPEMIIDSAYIQLQNSVQQTVAELNNSDQTGCSFQISGIDPLVVLASSAGCLKMAKNNSHDFDFSLSQPKSTVDGRDKPIIYYDFAGELEKHFKKPPRTVISGKDLINPAGPIELDPVNRLNNRAKLSANTLRNTAKLTPATGLKNGKTAVQGGLPAVAAPSTQKVMSGHLPSGRSLPNGKKIKNIAPEVSKTAGMQSTESRKTNEETSPRLQVMPVARTFRAPATVRITLKNAVHSRVPFELHHRTAAGRPYRIVKHPRHEFSRTNGKTSLTLFLNKAGQYQVRFRANHKSPWTNRQSFQVLAGTAGAVASAQKTGRSSVAARAINPQPEPPGKEIRPRTLQQNGTVRKQNKSGFDRAQQIRIALPRIEQPKNGRKFLLTGKSIHIKAEISHAAGQKIVVQVQIKNKNRFMDLKNGIRLNRMKDKTKVDILVNKAGAYRLRAGNSARGSRWSGWTNFNVDTLMKKAPHSGTTKPVNREKPTAPASGVGAKTRLQQVR